MKHPNVSASTCPYINSKPNKSSLVTAVMQVIFFYLNLTSIATGTDFFAYPYNGTYTSLKPHSSIKINSWP